MTNSVILLSLWMLFFFVSGALLGWGFRGIIEYRRHKKFMQELRDEEEKRNHWIH